MIPASERSREELEVSYRRYETVRTFNPVQFREVWEISLRGPRFDDLIDAIFERIERGDRVSDAIGNVRIELGGVK